MPPVGDNWLGLGPDKLHPTDVGYQIWADTMEPLLVKLLGTGQ
jgi:lysophospholipase L1-like esterase